MNNATADSDTLTYATTPGWWVPVLLDLFAWPALLRAGAVGYWLIDAVAVVLAVATLYVVTHPTLRYSAHSLSQSRGPFRTTVDLTRLASVRAVQVARRTNVLDPQTGESRSNIRWFSSSPDDWAGKPPIESYVVTDTAGHRLSLNAARTGAPWAQRLLTALREQPDVELGPRVVESLTQFAR